MRAICSMTVGGRISEYANPAPSARLRSTGYAFRPTIGERAARINNTRAAIK